MKKPVVSLPLAGAILLVAAANAWAGGGRDGREGFIIATDTAFAPFVFQNAWGEFIALH